MTHPKYGTISSNTIVPQPPTFSDFYCKNNSDTLSGVVQLNFNFTLDDLPENDYYFVRLGMPVYRFDNNVVGEYYGFNPIEISDLNILGKEYIYKGFIFSDESFDGNQIELSGVGKTLDTPHNFITVSDFPRVPQEPLFLDTTKIILRFEKLSYDAYLFYTSHAAYLDTWNDDYAEPTLIYNNIENGLGIFAGVIKFETFLDVE